MARNPEPPPKHRHSSSCYKTQLLCAKLVHSHAGNSCYKRDGTLKCSTKEHAHSGGSPCYGAVGPLCGYP